MSSTPKPEFPPGYAPVNLSLQFSSSEAAVESDASKAKECVACPDIGFPPIFLLFSTLDSSLRHAGSSHRLTQTPLRRTHVGRGTNKSSASQICQQILLLHVLEIPCRKVSLTTARFPALGRAQKLFILLIRKREDSALPNTTPLFCLGAIRPYILG